MGMYTELSIGVEFDQDMPKKIIEIITFMATSEEHECPKSLPDHPLFKTERWSWMLRSGGSAYFDRIPSCQWKYNEISRSWHLSLATNIKNYTEEWENFLDFIAPYVLTKGFIGTYRYEENDNPTLLYSRHGEIVFQKILAMENEE